MHHRSSQSLSCIIGSWITGMNDRLWFVYSGNFIMGHNLHLLLSLFYRSITYRRFLGSTNRRSSCVSFFQEFIRDKTLVHLFLLFNRLFSFLYLGCLLYLLSLQEMSGESKGVIQLMAIRTFSLLGIQLHVSLGLQGML